MTERFIKREELEASLREDQEYQNLVRRTEDSRTERLKALDLAAEPILKDLRAIGVSMGHLGGLYRIQPLSKDVVGVALKWLDSDVDTEIKSQLVSYLRKTKGKFDPTPLLRLFERTESKDLRSEIGHTLFCAGPTGISGWLVNTVSDPSFGEGRFGLFDALSKLAPPDEANPLLTALFDQSPLDSANALVRSGTKKELDFLERQCSRFKGPVQKELSKAATKLRKRLKLD